MEPIPFVTYILLAISCLVSYQGLKDYSFLSKYAFRVDDILIGKDYKRIITSGFFHVSWNHLLFNMITLYFFGKDVELSLGLGYFLLIYFGSMVGGDLFALFMHRQHGDYSAVGASGAISGLVFASIALYPGMEIGFLGAGLSIPAWLYGLLYVLGTIYGIKSQAGNIGHEAHFGGGLTGMTLALFIFPEMLLVNYVAILLILVPSIVFLFIVMKRPAMLLISNSLDRQKQRYSIDQKFNVEQQAREKELNRLLEKIGKQGYKNLSPEEKLQLQRLSEKQ